MSKIDCSIIVLSYNTLQITNECLTRVKRAVEFAKKHGFTIEVIVIDNASSDGSLEMLKKRHQLATIIASKENTGFSGGNNMGMKKSRGKYILLLNSDAYVKEDTLVQALNYFKDHVNCDVLGCQLRFANGNFQPSAGFLPTPINTILWISGIALLSIVSQFTKPIHPRDSSFFIKAKMVEWVMGAFLMLKREVYEKTGGFDESIFMYGEEVEWCKRIKDTGFNTWYVPQFWITHLDKASSKFMLKKPLLNEIKGIVRYFKQHYQNQYWWVKIVMGFSLILRAFAFIIFWNPPRRKAYLEALRVI